MTFRRAFRRRNPAKFHACFLRVMQQFAASPQGVVAIDGKGTRSREIGARATAETACHLLGVPDGTTLFSSDASASS